MAKGEVVLTANKVKRRKKLEKLVPLILLLLLLLLVIVYFVLNVVYNEGSFTISMDKNAYLNSNLIMYESLNDRSSVYKLSAKQIPFMDNISINWLPSDINKEAEGSHNGDNYIAYTFFLENKGDEVIDYWYQIVQDDVIKNVDDAVRIMIFIDDEKAVYAKKSPVTGEAEKDTIEFREDKDGIIILQERKGMEPGKVDRVTIVIWLEGDDPECVNAILGGEMKIHMDITEEHIEEKENI